MKTIRVYHQIKTITLETNDKQAVLESQKGERERETM